MKKLVTVFALLIFACNLTNGLIYGKIILKLVEKQSGKYNHHFFENYFKGDGNNEQ